MSRDGAPERGRRGPRFSLQARVLLLVALVNGAVFGVGLVVLTKRLAEERRDLTTELSRQLVYTVEPTIRTGGDLNVAQLLRWPSWGRFEDVVLLGQPIKTTASGDVDPGGAYLNPVGRGGRDATWDEQGVLRLIRDAVRSGEVEAGPRGVAFPLHDAEGDAWGGCWFVLPQSVDARELLKSLLPWFVVSTLLLTLVTFAALRRFVLGPVHQLADGSRRVSGGDFSVRLPVPRRRDEVADLVRGFNEMTATVHEYNERLAHQVRVATGNVRRAEAAAMTQRRLAATGELAAGVAHEINNPLGGLLNAVERLDGDLPPAKREQYHELLRGGLERIRATVGQLLRFTPRATRTGPVALVEPVTDALALVRHRVVEQGVSVVLRAADLPADAPPDAVRARLAALPPVVGEANELGQAVLNLLVNSLDALAERAREGGAGGGEIRVTIEPHGEGELRLTVEDDGPGVDPAELERVADLFYTTKEAGQGSGLGLAIVHNVVASHAGRIELDSAPGAGFRVTIDLPLWDGGSQGGA